MSGTDDDAVSLPQSSGSLSNGLLSDARSITNTVRGKRPWSRLENMELMWCYYKARAAGRGYQKRLKTLWDDRNPDKSFRSTNNLACQARAIINSKLLPEHELQDIQRQSSETDVSFMTDPPSLECAPPEMLSEDSLLVGGTSTDIAPQLEPLMDNLSEYERLVGCVEDCLADTSVSGDLKVAFNQIRVCLSEMGTLDLTPRQSLPRLVHNKVAKKWLCLVNMCVDKCIQKHIISFSQCDCLVYAGSLAVVQLSGQCIDRNGRRSNRGAWKVRLESQIKKCRSHVSQLLAIHRSTSLTARLQHMKSYLFKLYHIVDIPTFLIAVETLKQRITSLATRVRRNQTRLLRFWQNNTFRRNQKLLYCNFRSDSQLNYVGAPDKSNLITFRKSIFERDSTANLDGSWLPSLREKFSKEV